MGLVITYDVLKFYIELIKDFRNIDLVITYDVLKSTGIELLALTWERFGNNI